MINFQISNFQFASRRKNGNKEINGSLFDVRLIFACKVMTFVFHFYVNLSTFHSTSDDIRMFNVIEWRINGVPSLWYLPFEMIYRRRIERMSNEVTDEIREMKNHKV